jgi:exopolysaccharide production protein ExoQ
MELAITWCFCLFCLGIDLPKPIPSALALLSFFVIPLLIVSQGKKFIYVATRDIPLLLAIGTPIISVVWSTNPEQTLAHNRAFLSSTAFGIYLATRYTPKEQMRLMVWLFGIYVLLNLVTSLVLPAYGISDTDGLSWQGIAGHKNSLAAAMAIAATLFLDLAFYGYKYRRIFFLGAGIAFIILLLSKGKGGLASFVGLLPLLPLYKIAKQNYKLRTFFSVFAFVISLVIIVATLANLEFIVVDLLGKDMEFTGRIPLWNYLIQRGMERPWLGYGYAAFWTNPTETLQIALNVPWMSAIADGAKAHAHSAYLDLFLQLGWLGVLLVTLSFLTMLFRVILLLGLTRQIEYFWILQLLLFMAIGNIANNSGEFLAYRSLYWVLYVSSACSTAIQLKRILRTGNKLVNLKYENTTYQH